MSLKLVVQESSREKNGNYYAIIIANSHIATALLSSYSSKLCEQMDELEELNVEKIWPEANIKGSFDKRGKVLSDINLVDTMIDLVMKKGCGVISHGYKGYVSVDLDEKELIDTLKLLREVSLSAEKTTTLSSVFFKKTMEEAKKMLPTIRANESKLQHR